MFIRTTQLFLLVGVVILAVIRMGVGIDKIRIIRIGDNLHQNSYFSNCTDYITSDKYENYCFVLIGSASFACPTGDYIMIIEQAQKKHTKYKFVVVMFNDYSEKDFTNMRLNNDLQVEFMSASNNLQALNNQDLFPFGLVFVSNPKGKVTYIDNLQNSKMKVSDTIEKIINVVKENKQLGR